VNRVMIPMLTTTMMTPMERAAGRFMRAPDHPTGNEPPAQGGNEPPASGNNTGGNGDGTGNVTPAEITLVAGTNSLHSGVMETARNQTLNR
jgi:hypothetical protein